VRTTQGENESRVFAQSSRHNQGWNHHGGAGEGRRTYQGVTVGGNTATTAFTLNDDDELTSTSSSTGGFTNSYSYDDNGEQIGRVLSGTTYSQDFDYDGQIVSTTGGSATSYTTDAIGRRVSRTAGGTTTNFQYSGDSVLLEKQSGTTTATYTYGNALIRKDGETPLYDGLGTARAETSSAQAVTFTETPDAFGNTVATTGSTASSYGFAGTFGYRTDGDAGLMKVGARYYDPPIRALRQVGSFKTRDTDLGLKLPSVARPIYPLETRQARKRSSSKASTGEGISEALAIRSRTRARLRSEESSGGLEYIVSMASRRM
jgi:hypothetical protein